MNLKKLVEMTKNLKVLYVEDNEDVRLEFKKLLDIFFDNIDTASDGLEGFEKYKNNNVYYDLVISDIVMPNMDGIDMSKAILNMNDRQQIIIISTYDDSHQLQELIDIGVTNYIHKPVELDGFSKALQKTVYIINKRREAKNEFNKIERLNSELDALIDTFDTYVIASRTDLKGMITYASKAYEKISGYTKEELIGKAHSIIRHPNTPKEIFKNLWNTIKNGKLWTGEIENLRKDGTSYWVEANIAPYYDAKGNHIGYSAIRIDITAKKRAEHLNEEVTNLLNNAGQGFLSFDKNMKIDESFSKECLNLFNSNDIYNQNISDILFGNDKEKQELFNEAISRIIDTEEIMVKEMYLSLLPSEHNLNYKDIKIEYKILPRDKFMLVLSDITNTKKLESKIKKQNQIQKMIVSIASNKQDFLEIKTEFESFIKNPSRCLNTLLMELHTFKGVFAQKEMLLIVDAIHELETKINEATQNGDLDMSKIMDIFSAQDLQNIFDLDIQTVLDVLGEEFLEDNNKMSINIKLFETFESKIKKLKSQESNCDIKDILNVLEKFKYESLYDMLKAYPLSVKQIAGKLDKYIYPLIIEGDKNISVSPKFKPFIKSLIHLFNNCVEHGIEDIETRLENQKDEIGSIKCEFNKIDNNIEIIIYDDGFGINVDKLSKSAMKNKIVSQTELENLDENEKLMLVFSDSLSTKDEISTTSGRGIGMSAIKNEIDKLNGTIQIENNIGRGVRFLFTLPLENK